VYNFNQAHDLKKAEVEAMLEELVRKQSMYEKNTLEIEFHIKVLALIRNE